MHACPLLADHTVCTLPPFPEFEKADFGQEQNELVSPGNYCGKLPTTCQHRTTTRDSKWTVVIIIAKSGTTILACNHLQQNVIQTLSTPLARLESGDIED